MSEAFRAYGAAELGPDGYPPEWHRLGDGHDDLLDVADIVLPGSMVGIKDVVRKLAGDRCVRCHHPYRKSTGEWSPCDARCTHRGPVRYYNRDRPNLFYTPGKAQGFVAWEIREAQWRILTVHHLDGDKANCRWWNLAALCQRCHLAIQGRVQMARVWPWEHSEWFQPYAAGYYARVYLGEDISREQAIARLDELLALERVS